MGSQAESADKNYLRECDRVSVGEVIRGLLRKFVEYSRAKDCESANRSIRLACDIEEAVLEMQSGEKCDK